MSYQTDEPIKLTRDCQVVAVPAGHTLMLPQGTEVMITQSLGGSYTLLVPSYGGLFRHLLERVPGLTCLITSRQPLRLSGEQEFPIQPLPAPDPRFPKDLLTFPSVQLFVDRG